MKDKNIIIVTGGAGFIGSNLIEKLLSFKKYKIISLDNYSSGFKKNHIKNKRVKYIRGDINNIKKILHSKKNSINTLFHFGEFSRIYQSFLKSKQCFNSNTLGSNAVFEFCLENKIKIIYSATSATLGNRKKNMNLSPYAFTKAKNLELLENLKNWFNLKYEVIYFYNVYGKNHIRDGDMSTVIGIFENQYLKKKPLTIVKPGNQTRKFTHIDDTIKVCIEAWTKNKCKHYAIASKKNFSIIQIAKLFGGPIKFLPPRLGERYTSKITNKNVLNKIINRIGEKSIKNYIEEFKKNN